MMKKIFRIFIKILLYGFAAFFTIIVVLLLVFWSEHSGSLTLPWPTGSYAVGRTTFDWVDSTRIDPLATKPGVRRELTVWIWYPASYKKTYPTAEYLPVNWRKALARKQGFIMSNFFTRNLSKVHSHSVTNPELSKEQVKYPVVFLKSGIGTLATDYTTLAEDLASHGYIVVGNDSPYSTFIVVYPDGRINWKTTRGNPGETGSSIPDRTHLANTLIRIWSDDTKFMLTELEKINTDSKNRFYGKINLKSVGIFGHSFGGATAAQFCHDDPRCKAGIDMDGAPFGTVVLTGFKKPFMFLLASHEGESDPMSIQIKANIRGIYNSLPKSRVLIFLHGAKHFNFTDMALTKEKVIFRLVGATGPIGGRHGLEVEAGCVRTFFDVYLKGQPVTNIMSLATQYPEVKIEK
jgi:predicted dienelactone hydrolase